MSASAAVRPNPDEHAPEYARYISLVPEGNVVDTLSRQIKDTIALLRSIDEKDAGRGYEPDKWSVKQLVGHLIDGERVFTYRALRFARGDSTPLPGFEQDDYVRGADFNSLALADLVEEFEQVRASTVSFFRHLPKEAWSRRGVARTDAGPPAVSSALARTRAAASRGPSARSDVPRPAGAAHRPGFRQSRSGTKSTCPASGATH